MAHRASGVTMVQVRRMRELREEGYSLCEVAAIVGVHRATVGRYASGYGHNVGRIENEDLRWAFYESGLSASEVARRLGWDDAGRLRRTLGIARDRTGGRWVGYRQMVAVDTAVRIAEAIDVDPQVIGVREREVA